MQVGFHRIFEDKSIPIKKREIETDTSEEKVDALAIAALKKGRFDCPPKWRFGLKTSREESESESQGLKRCSSTSESDVDEMPSGRNVKRVSYAGMEESLDGKFEEIVSKNFPFTASLNLMGECIKENNFYMAFELATAVFNMLSAGKATNGQKKQAIDKFNETVKLGIEVLGQHNYAWLRCVLTWVLEQKDLRTGENHEAEILAGYEEAAHLDLYLGRCNLASYLESRGKFAEAYEQWQLCTRLFPHEGRPYNQMGVLLELGWEGKPVDLVAARRCYDQGFKLDYPDAITNLAKVLYETDVLTEEMRNQVLHLYKIAGGYSQAIAWFNLGVIHQEGWARTLPEGKICDKRYQNLSLAEECFRKAYEIAPNEQDYREAIAETIFMDETRLTRQRAIEALNLYGKDWMKENPVEANTYRKILAELK